MRDGDTFFLRAFQVHERSIESDFLLIILKSLLQLRPDLKYDFPPTTRDQDLTSICRVILMSATLDANKISAYFDNCPTLQVPGRTFPVEVQFLEDAVEYTKWQVDQNSPYAMRRYNSPHVVFGAHIGCSQSEGQE